MSQELDDETKKKVELFRQAKARADALRQNYPGEGFEHSIETLPPGMDGLQLIDARITCPCGCKPWISRVPRSQGDYDIIVCPDCFYWHVIRWFNTIQPPKNRGHFILPPIRP